MRGRDLGERILALDAEAVALRGELARRRAAAPAFQTGPRARRGTPDWTLRDDPTRSPESLTPYERRPDDAAIVAAREGAAFLAAPDPALVTRAARPRSDEAEVSIVIPVHGQLAWTLNCLHGLVAHASRYSFEIIVVDDASTDDSATVIETLTRKVTNMSVLRRPRNGGFIAACNDGAATARGRFVVLLNNDTRVAECWLDGLIGTFARHPRAGLAGSKLLYPDGGLQEAGAILWRDGAAWNFGRGADPNHPTFCHARRADYVSGASVAMPMDLWRRLGGLDAHFAPAYGEDADLAMRVRQAGREVWFQPASRVIHYEGRTGGTDLSEGPKAFQVDNLKKLFVRWHATLASHGRHGTDPYFEREREVRRRALVVDATTPTPNQDAGSVVTTATIRLLQGMGLKVHFVAQDNFLFQPDATGALQADGVECGYAPFDVGFDDFLARHGALFDVVVVFRPGVFAAVEAAVRRFAAQAALVFSNADLHFLRNERMAGLRGDANIAALANERARELELIARAPVTMVLSTFERDLLAREAPNARVVLQPFPFAVVGTQVEFDQRENFVFLGGYGHPPNVDAACFFVREILPLIRRALPNARAILAGAHATPEVMALAGDFVDVVGHVDDLGGLFDAARVCVCPLRAGAGVKGKVIAAMAHGLPVVATGCAAEGMDFRGLVADDPAGFAAACVRLHRDPVLWRELSAASLDYVAESCSSEAGTRALSAAIDAAFARQLGLESDDGTSGSAG